MSLFDINYSSLVTQLLPVRLRKTVMIHWLQCLAAPVVWLYNLFTANRSGNLYILAHNSQIVFLQAALNDTFDAVSRGIYIVDGSNEDPLFTYLTAENEPLWLGRIGEIGTTPYPDPQWLYTSSETTLAGYGFIVKVPSAVTYDAVRMKALINLYRLSGRNVYEIVSY